MKNQFTINNPVVLHFGKDILKDLPGVISRYGKRVLFLYGKGSAVKYGYYQKIRDLLDENGFFVFEYSGINPNPSTEDVEAAYTEGINNDIEVILALGGGSVTDTAKAVSLCIPERLPVWDVVKYKKKPSKAIPLITVLTLAATGSEMNAFSVIQNSETKEKLGFGYPPLSYPKHSFLNPEFTYSVPADYTAYGIVDIIAHAFENFFGGGDSSLADRFAVSIIKEAVHYAPLVLKEPENYEYRANIMLQSACALSGITSYGKEGGDWGVHSAAHVLSVLYDMPHGASLSIVYPAWFRLQKNRIPERLKRLASLLFDTENIEHFITLTEDFFLSIKSPVSLKTEGFSEKDKSKIIHVMRQNKVSGNNYKLSSDDITALVELMFS
ncbi:MAG: iron-containing alcohol dehydrogenase [Chlorobi bacterium]|nr:iron-containing alcohol dehydrogenase [Chlorobiota bacterium]